MADSSDAFMGRLSGRIGNLVVYQMYGKTVVRVRPGFRTKKTTPKLKASQNDFKTVVKVLSPLKHLLRFGFAAQAINRSAWNAAASANLNRYRQSENKDIHEWLQLSAGTLAQAMDWQAIKDDNGNIQLSWENDTKSNGRGNDKLIVFCVGDTSHGGMPFMEITTANRMDKQASLVLQNPYNNIEIDIYTAFISADYNSNRKLHGISDSVWVGRIDA
jgi:hypothetical protein